MRPRLGSLPGYEQLDVLARRRRDIVRPIVVALVALVASARRQAFRIFGNEVAQDQPLRLDPHDVSLRTEALASSPATR